MNSFFARRYVVTIIFIAVALVLLARLFYIQIIDDRYILFAKNNVVRTRIVFPARGPILDRNNKVLVQNQPVYDIMVTPKMVKPFDTLEFCKLLGIDMKGFHKRFEGAIAKGGFTHASVFEGQLSSTLYASLQERLYEFPGFDVQLRSVRSYPDSIAAHFLGYTDEVRDNDIEKSNGYYHLGDYIGRTGVERSYEKVLRGQRGIQNLMVDSKGTPKGKFANGVYDTAAVAGERLISSLDLRIQKLGEELMRNKLGSIVAIEPSSGEILAFVSSPGYDPNKMVGRDHGNNYMELQNDPNKPLVDRAIAAYYPPGSSFKPLAALVALQHGIITPQTTVNCPGYYWAGNHKVGCTHHHGIVNLSSAIEGSCNAYFCWVFEKLINSNGPKMTDTTYGDWKKQVNRFGYGVRLGIDLNNEKSGNLPSTQYFDKRFGGKGRWRSSSVISLAIGQGEVSATPLQLANTECIIANEGYYYKPHLIKAVGDKKVIKEEFTKRNYVGVDSGYFRPVINGMQAVVERGTGASSKIPGIIMCGKTGTAQVNGKKNNSVFVAYAPRDNPKIAIAVVVESSGQGAWWAAPMAAFMVEKYLKDSITISPYGHGVQWYKDQNLLPELAPKPGLKPVLPKDSVKPTAVDTGNKPRLPKQPAKKAKPIAVAMLTKKEDRNEQ